MTYEQMQMVAAEIDRQHIARNLKIAIGNTNTPDDYAAMITRERYAMQVYEDDGGIVHRIGTMVLVVWACVWLALISLSEYLTREA